MYSAKNYGVKTTQVWGGEEEVFVFTKLNFAAVAELKMREMAQCKLNTCAHDNIM